MKEESKTEFQFNINLNYALTATANHIETTNVY